MNLHTDLDMHTHVQTTRVISAYSKNENTSLKKSSCLFIYILSCAAFRGCQKVRIYELGGHSSNFTAFMCFEVTKWEHHGCLKDEGLYLNVKSI